MNEGVTYPLLPSKSFVSFVSFVVQWDVICRVLCGESVQGLK